MPSMLSTPARILGSVARPADFCLSPDPDPVGARLRNILEQSAIPHLNLLPASARAEQAEGRTLYAHDHHSPDRSTVQRRATRPHR